MEPKKPQIARREISFRTHHPAIMDEEKSAELNVTAIEEKPVKPRGFFARIRYYEELMDRKMGIESHSLDRVLPEARNPPNPLVMAFMWASATMNISCFSTGFLGYEFGLSLGDSIPIIIFATLLGACVTVRMPSLSQHLWNTEPFYFFALLGLVRDHGSRHGTAPGRHFQVLFRLLPFVSHRGAERG